MRLTPVEQLIQVRLNQAEESLQEAKILFEAGLYRGTINRGYYAMFYAVSALAILRQEVTSKHSGLITFFDREYIKSGVFPHRTITKNPSCLSKKTGKRLCKRLYSK